MKDLVEIDEIYITAGEKGIKQDRPRRRGLRRRGRGTYDGDKPPVQAFTERRGKTRSKGTYRETILKRRLKQSLKVR